MPFLISNQQRIDFKDIDFKSASLLPADLRSAAKLIARWKAGEKVFEMATSGSTGSPKMIFLYRDKITYSAHQTAEAFGLKEGDNLFCCLGLNYIAGFMMVMRALVNKCNLTMAEPSSNPLADVHENAKIDFSSFVPMQMETMMKDDNAIKIINGMKAILVGGAQISKALEEHIQVIKAPVYQTYSMTETYTHVAVKQLNGEERSDFYKPLPGVNISLDERDCLVISSFLTDNQPLVTNDLAQINPDGTFNWLGRYDNVINSGGVKIQLEKIEAVCAEVFKNMGVNVNYMAAGLPDEKLGEKLVLIVEREGLKQEIINEINDQLSKLLNKFEMPKDILFVDRILLTNTRKVDRKGTLELI